MNPSNGGREQRGQQRGKKSGQRGAHIAGSAREAQRRCPMVPVALGSIIVDPHALQDSDSFGPRCGREESREAAEVGTAKAAHAVASCDAIEQCEIAPMDC